MARGTRATATAVIALGALASIGLRVRPVPPAPAVDVRAVDLGAPSVDAPMDDAFLRQLGASSVAFRVVRDGDDPPVWVFMAWFDRQREGSQVHSPRNCYPGAGWSIVAERRVRTAAGPERELVVDDGTHKRLVRYWYRVDGRRADDALAIKRAMVFDALRGRPTDVAFVRVSTPLDDAERARDRLERMAARIDRRLVQLREAAAGEANR